MQTNLEKRAIEAAWKAGYFWDPKRPEAMQVKQSDLPKLSVDDDFVVDVLIAYSKGNAREYTKSCLNTLNRLPNFDGVVGPAFAAFVEIPRCPVPDFAPPKGTSFLFDDPDVQAIAERMQRNQVAESFGQGNWPGCHDIGSFHCVAIKWNTSGLPSFLEPVFLKVLRNVRAAYAQTGLLILFTDPSGTDLLTGKQVPGQINVNASFVGSSAGWIGLANVGQNETCSTSALMCKFLNTYRGGSSLSDIEIQWTTLIKHEVGHLTGAMHTNGGVLNPTLVNGLPTLFQPNDPVTAFLMRMHGGVAVDIPGDVPQPPTPPPGHPTIESRVKSLEAEIAKQDAINAWLIAKIHSLS